MTPQQIPLPIPRRSVRIDPLTTTCPLPLHVRKLKRAVRRAEKRGGVPADWNLRAYLNHQAVLDQVRVKARVRARNQTGRNSARGLSAYVCTPEGRRVARVIAQLSLRLARQEKELR